MSQPISFRQFLALSFFLFSMFLGAGNIIFAPPLGQAAGTNTWVAMSGFLITGVGLVLLAIMALSISGGSVEKLSGRVSPGFAVFFSILLFMTLGPIYVVPRTAAVVYEITVTPFLSENIVANYMQWALLVFSVLFIWATIYLSLEPKKFVKRIGNILTPIFLILLLVIVLSPTSTPSAISANLPARISTLPSARASRRATTPWMCWPPSCSARSSWTPRITPASTPST
ncbi:branched-subunit amino acid permease [Kerstersia gyiorum]|nr:branched-subunit amino acid permease [Kerstersia gyiorum]MCP1824320.1 branched-subunit amino acid permease [Kerstersia gyiorum]MCP1827730.1 branched-subunit amino acid permease [Kerstersia gyiorum]MCW2451394.1 branched-subunit amino acid permease [Kerstersia gyiorum]